MPGSIGWNSAFGGCLGLLGRPVQQHSILLLSNYIIFASILIIPLAKLPEINGRVAQRAVLQLKLLDLRLIHLVFASLAAVIVSGGDGLATDHAGWEVAATGAANRVVLAYCFFAVSARALQALPWSLLWRMLGEDVDCDLHVPLSLLRVAHALELHESAGTLLVALCKEKVTLL